MPNTHIYTTLVDSVHMSEVQGELKSLKQQVVLAEAALNDDTRYVTQNTN